MGRKGNVIHQPHKDSSTKELAEIKKENHQLRRKLARAEKLSQKLLENSALEISIDPEAVEKMEALRCPDCPGNLSQLELGNRTILVCKACGHRHVT